MVRFFTPCTADWGLDFWPNQKRRTLYTSSVHCQDNPALNSCSSITAVSPKPETTWADFLTSMGQQLRTSYLGQTCALTFPGSCQGKIKLKAHSTTPQHHTALCFCPPTEVDPMASLGTALELSGISESPSTDDVPATFQGCWICLFLQSFLCAPWMLTSRSQVSLRDQGSLAIESKNASRRITEVGGYSNFLAS